MGMIHASIVAAVVGTSSELGWMRTRSPLPSKTSAYCASRVTGGSATSLTVTVMVSDADIGGTPSSVARRVTW